jgi:hypothetical protein
MRVEGANADYVKSRAEKKSELCNFLAHFRSKKKKNEKMSLVINWNRSGRRFMTMIYDSDGDSQSFRRLTAITSD